MRELRASAPVERHPVSDLWPMNGIDAATGRYLLEISPTELARVARGQTLDPMLGELKFRARHADESHFGVKAGVDVKDLAQTGWAVIFPATADPTERRRQAAVREALSPLLALRREQATRRVESYYKEYIGPDGVRPGEDKQRFLARHHVGPGPADPEKVPYYLLIVGEPRDISFRFQSQIGVQYAAGRVCFDTVEEYAHYAASVVAAEKQSLALARRLAFFAVDHDKATALSARHLVEPLADLLAKDPQLAGWSVERTLREHATRDALAALLRRDPPALLFTASHGLGLPNGDPSQLRHQGALLCQDWAGHHGTDQRIDESHFLAGEHVPADADLLGTIAFMFACYGAGTPELDEFAAQAFKQRTAVSPHPFVAALPKALLSRPKGGALAVIGHIERAWTFSFMWPQSGERGHAGAQLAVFESAMKSLMHGFPVGAAMEYFDERYAELSTDLSVKLEDAKFGVDVDDNELARMWTANNDARGYAILGDPAVRAMTAPGPDAPGRAAIAPIALRTTPTATPLASPPVHAPLPASPPVHAAIEPPTITSFAAPTRATPPPAPSQGTSPIPPPAASAPAPSTSLLPPTPATPPPASPPPLTAPAGLRARLEALLPELCALTTEVTTGSTSRPIFRTTIDVRGAIDSRVADDVEPTRAQREHHESMVRAAIDRQQRLLALLLKRLE